MEGENKNIVSLDEIKNEARETNQKEAIKETVQLVVFKLGNEEYALPIAQVKEVVQTPKMARVPHTPDFILGVTNIRGAITAVIDLGIKFGMTSIGENGNYILVVEDDKLEAGVLVNEVPTTINIAVDDIDDSNEVLQYSGENQKYIVGIAKVNNRMILLIDIVSMLTQEDISEVSEL